MRRPSVAAAALGLGLALAGCSSDPLGGPVRAATHGYRARITFKTDGLETDSYEIAVRGALVRKGLGDGPALVVDGAARKAWRLAAGGKGSTPLDYAAAEKEIPSSIPLAPGFDEKAEAARRGLALYHREGDEVFAGHACALWRFDDDPSALNSPTTTYWVAPDLDNLVVRWERELPSPGAAGTKFVINLTDVRVGAPASLFSPGS
ncbi:MAG TPA: hypothetical protein VMN04_04315 [Thermoanaerobaculia bacterium]|nr:hypothetical protein [Thermoanaerobaculia bacterium]